MCTMYILFLAKQAFTDGVFYLIVVFFLLNDNIVVGLVCVLGLLLPSLKRFCVALRVFAFGDILKMPSVFKPTIIKRI